MKTMVTTIKAWFCLLLFLVGPTLLANPKNAAAQFDGQSTSYIQIQNLTGLANSGLTFESWFFIDSAQNAQLFELTEGATSICQIQFNTDLSASLTYGEASGTLAATYTTGSWQHLAVVINPTTNTATVLVNETAVGQVDISTANLTLTSSMNLTLKIGQSLAGRLDDVKLWNTALNINPTDEMTDNANVDHPIFRDDEIYSHTAIGFGHPQYEQLVGYWKFDQIRHQQVVDHKFTRDDLARNEDPAQTKLGSTFLTRFHGTLNGGVVRELVTDNTAFIYQGVIGYVRIGHAHEQLLSPEHLIANNEILYIGTAPRADGTLWNEWPDNSGTPVNGTYALDATRNSGVLVFDGTGSMNVDRDLFHQSNWAVPALSDYSFEGWFYFEDFAQEATLIAKDQISIKATTAGQIQVTTATANSLTSNKVLAPQNWYHLAVTVSQAGQTTLYFKEIGETEHTLDVQATLTQAPLSEAATIIGENFNGKMDELKVWHSMPALSSFDAATPRNWSNRMLKAHWTFDDAENVGYDSRSWIAFMHEMQASTANTKGIAWKLGLGSSSVWKDVVADTAKRAVLVDAVIDCLERYQFVGVDVDFEWCYDQTEYNNYSAFIVDLGNRLGGADDFSVTVHPLYYGISAAARQAADYISMQNYGIGSDRWRYSEFRDWLDTWYNSRLGLAVGDYVSAVGFYGHHGSNGRSWTYRDLLNNGGFPGAPVMNGAVREYSLMTYQGDTDYSCHYHGIEDIVPRARDTRLAAAKGIMYWDLGCDLYDYSNPMSLMRALNTQMASNVIPTPPATPEVTKLFVDLDLASSGEGTTWGTAINNLQTAIAAADEGMEIWVKGGTHDPGATININKSVKIYGGFAGTETNLSQRALDSANPWDFTHKTKITGARTHFNITASNVIVDGLWSWRSEAGTEGYGGNHGGILCSGSDVIIRNTIVQGHWPWYSGSSAGGIYLSAGSATIDQCWIYKNRVKNGGGAGLAISGGTHLIQNSLIQENFSNEQATTNGAGIKVSGGSNHQIVNCSIIGNELSGNANGVGGGIYTSVPITISGCQIAGNILDSTAEAGGGIHNTAAGTAVINSLIVNNTGSGFHTTAAASIVTSTIAKNQTLATGASGLTASGSYFTVRDCILWGNEKGGANAGQLGQVGNSATTADNNNSTCFVDDTLKFCAMQPSGNGTFNAQTSAWIGGVLGGDGTRTNCTDNVTLTFTNPSTTAGAAGYLAAADWNFTSDTLTKSEDYGVALSQETINISGAQTIPLFYKGVAKQALFRVKIDALALNESKTLSQLVFTLDGTTAVSDITAAELYKSSVRYFSPNTGDAKGATKVGDGVISGNQMTFDLTEAVAEGQVYYWLTVTIAADAAGKNHVDATLASATISGVTYSNEIINANPDGAAEIFHHQHRISPYYRVDNLLRWYPGRLKPAHFNVITDVIIFNVRPHADGTMNFPDGSWKPEYSDSDADGKLYFDEAVAQLKALRGSADVELLLGVVTGEFPTVAADPQLTDTFATNLVNYAVEAGLDGIDIDWEYPTNEQQWINFANFVSVLREKMYPYGLTLGCAINPNYQQPKTYFLDQFDVVNSMSYDRGAGTNGNHSPYGADGATGTGSHQADYHWLTQTMGQPKEKVVMGIPMYTCPHQNSNGGNVDWSGTQRGYGNILEEFPNLLPHVNSFYPARWDNKYHSFNGKDTLQQKVTDMLNKGYSGLMIWGFDTDVDFDNPRSAMRALSQMYKPEMPFHLIAPAHQSSALDPAQNFNLEIQFDEAVTVQPGAKAVIYTGTSKAIDLAQTDAYEIYTTGNELVSELPFTQSDLTNDNTYLTLTVPADTLQIGQNYWIKIEREALKYTAKDEFWTGCLHEDYWNFATSYIRNPNFLGADADTVFNGWTKSENWGTNYGSTTGITGRTTVYSGVNTATLSQITNKRIAAGETIKLVAELRRDNNGYRDKTIQMKLIAVADDNSETEITSEEVAANGTYYRVLSHSFTSGSAFIGQRLKVLVGNTSTNVWTNYYSVNLEVIDDSLTPALGLKVQQIGNQLIWTVEREVDVREYLVMDVQTGTIYAALTATGQNQYQATIPAGAQVQLVVVDHSGFHQTFLPQNAGKVSVSYDLQAGWQMLALPGEDADLSALTALVGDNLWIWTGTDYQKTQQIEPTQAFWIYLEEPATPTITANASNRPIELKSGWNMVGPVENCEIPAAADAVYSWDQIYQNILEQGVLIQGIGYWIYVK